MTTTQPTRLWHDQIAAMTATLVAAERDRREIPQFSAANPELDVASAYRVQQAFVQSKIDAGEPIASDRFIHPRVESEIAYVVADDASAGAFYLGPIARRPDELDLRGCSVAWCGWTSTWPRRRRVRR